MVFQAALTAVRPNSFLNAPRMAAPAWWTRYQGRLIPSSLRLPASETRAAVIGLLHAGNRLGDFGALEFLPSRIPSSTRVHASGLSCALRQARSSASAPRPFGLRFPSATDPP